MRVVECAELIAADLFQNADQIRERITFSGVERHLAQGIATSQRPCDTTPAALTDPSNYC